MITKRQLKADLKYYKKACEELEERIDKLKNKPHSPGVECEGCKNLILHETPLLKSEFYCKLDRNCKDFEEVTKNEN